MANQFPTESTTSSTSGGSATGMGSSPSGTGASAGTSIGNASGLGSGSTGSSSGSGYGGVSSSGSGSSFGAATATAERPLTIDKAVQATHQAVDRAAGTVGQAAEKLRSSYDHLMEMEAEWADTARSRVRESPLAAVGIALAVGLVLGRLTAHR